MRRNGTKVKAQVAGVGSAYVEDVSGDGHTLLFRRDQGLWVEADRPGAKRASSASCPTARRPTASSPPTASGSPPSSPSRSSESLVSIDVANAPPDASSPKGFDLDAKATAPTIGPVIAWQPALRRQLIAG